MNTNSQALLFCLTCSALMAEPPFEVPDPIKGQNGTELRLFAKEPFLRNTVAVAVGDDGRVYATSVVRRKAADLDIRQFREWVEEDLSLKTVEEKRAFLRRELTSENGQKYRRVGDQNEDGVIDWRDLTVLTDRILVLEDTDGDGIADRSDTFAEGFNSEVTGIAAGLEVWDGKVYATVEPELLRLTDTEGGPASDERTVLANGFSVHIAYAGHNFSGPVMGPDGRLYMSSPDKGMHVTTKEGRTFSHPLSGTIARCEPDGSNFEVFAYGLRNAQEVAFDSLGNLFAVDNDGDQKGEKERLVYITRGSDHGWRYHWQYRGKDYQPWMQEGLSKPEQPGRPAYSTPPLSLYHDGPAGFAFNPGTALNEHYRDHFFMTGFPARKLYAFQLKPKGASYEIAGDHVVANGVLMVGLDFGPDGALYVADWSAKGYELNEKGGVWKLDDPRETKSRIRRDTAAILASEMSDQSVMSLLEHLAHPDQRVRMKGQFELVRRQREDVLLSIALAKEHRLARIHAIWGMGQLLRRHHKQWPKEFEQLYRDPDSEIRAQAARVAGDSGNPDLIEGDSLLPLLRDPADRPRFFAALALGSLRHSAAVPDLVNYLALNGSDPYHRHASIVGLAGCATPEQLVGLFFNESVQVRLAAVVALRRLRHPGVATYLNDEDPLVVAEAARAIYDDEPIAAAQAQLAALLNSPSERNEATIRRAMGAALRLRNAKNAESVARVAGNEAVPEQLRLNALRLLREWPRPPKLDSVLGRYQELSEVNAASLVTALTPTLTPLMDSKNVAIQKAAREAAEVYGIGMDPEELLSLIRKDDPERSPAALRSLASSPERQRGAALDALSSKHPAMRAAALSVLAELEPGQFAEQARKILESTESLVDRRAALEGLTSKTGESGRELLLETLKKVRAKALSPELTLDVLEAIRTFENEQLSREVEDYLSTFQDSTLPPFAGVLDGGNPEKGNDLFNNHVAAQCIRCHGVGDGGSEVGPNLARIGEKDPAYLLSALVDPGRDIAPGFGITSLTLKDGTTISGSLLAEDDDKTTIREVSGEERSVPKSTIASQTPAVSSMPPMGAILSKRELRDLLAYLRKLK